MAAILSRRPGTALATVRLPATWTVQARDPTVQADYDRCAGHFQNETGKFE
jgi:hypothetical protein